MFRFIIRFLKVLAIACIIGVGLRVIDVVFYKEKEDKTDKQIASEIITADSSEESNSQPLENIVIIKEQKEKKQKQRAEIEDEIQNEEAINLRLEKFKNIFANRTILEEFDREVFECLIEKIIIGEEKEDGTYDPYTIKFICRGDSNSQSMFLSSNQGNSSMSLSDQPAMWNV